MRDRFVIVLKDDHPRTVGFFELNTVELRHAAECGDDHIRDGTEQNEVGNYFQHVAAFR